LLPALAAVLVTCLAAAQHQGTAEGTLTHDGAVVRLQHAYAVPDGETLRIILTDAPLAAADLEDVFPLSRLGREGKVHAVEVVMDQQKNLKRVGLYLEIFESASMGVMLLKPAVHQFTATEFTSDAVAGKLSMAAPEKYPWWAPGAMGPPTRQRTYQFNATFKAPIYRKPGPTAEGKAAEESGPGQAATAFLKAARAGDKAALKKCVTPDAAVDLDGPDAAAFLKALPELFSAQMKVVRVWQSEKTAEVEAEAHPADGKETAKFQLVLVDGVWKVGSF
jgi:hypothetical protein